MKKRVLILSVSAGTGHVRAAEALLKGFRGQPWVEAAEHLDALNYTNRLFRDFYSKFYIRLVKSAPEVLGWSYKVSDAPWKTDAVRLWLDRCQSSRLVRRIRHFRPDITLCTHFMPMGIMAHLIEKDLIATHLSAVVTDMDMHAMWLSRTFHRYFVAMEETKEHLLALGLPADRITVSGIPVDPVFAEPNPGSGDEPHRERQRALRRELGLEPDTCTLLFSAGAYGASPADGVVSRLQRLRLPVQVVTLCGKIEGLQKRVEALVKTGGAHNPVFHVLGYTSRMHDYMHAADLLLGKPGGLTSAEALVCGLPMAILSPIPGQEERNSDHLLEEGAAIKCNELTTLPYKLDRLLGDPARLARMRENARALGRPNAVRTVVQTLCEDTLPPLHIDAQGRERIARAAECEGDGRPI
jgi:processive 1,2-diacylglycerol beta-glucosyltransferase